MTTYNFNSVNPERVADLVIGAKEGTADITHRNKEIDTNLRFVINHVTKELTGGSHAGRFTIVRREDALAEAKRFLKLNRRRPCMHRIHGCTELAEPQMRMCKYHGDVIRGVM